MLPRDYITEDGFQHTAKGRKYLAPLIKGEDYPPYKDAALDRIRRIEKRVLRQAASL